MRAMSRAYLFAGLEIVASPGVWAKTILDDDDGWSACTQYGYPVVVKGRPTVNGGEMIAQKGVRASFRLLRRLVFEGGSGSS